MRTTKEQRKAFEAYIMGCIDPEGYEIDGKQVNPQTDLERLQFVWDTFQAEYGHQRPYYGGSEQRTFENWLMGLPSCFNIDFENYKILDLCESFGVMPDRKNLKGSPLEKYEQKYLNQWWARVYMTFKRLFYRAQRKVSLELIQMK